MRKWFVMCSLALALGQAQAGPASAESVERLLALTRVESLIDQMYGSVDTMMRQAMRQAAGGRNLSPEQQRVMEQLPSKFVAVMREEFNWALMKPKYVRVYQDVFEQEEIDGLIAFYASPVGQSYVAKLPLATQKSMAMAQDMMRTLMPRMQRAVEEAVREAKIAE